MTLSTCGPIASYLLLLLILFHMSGAWGEGDDQNITNNNVIDANITRSKPRCEATKNLSACLQQLPPILDQAEMTGIPSSKKDVEASCSAFKTGMGCIDDYANNCLNARDRKILENNLFGARYTFRFLCDDPGFQSEYLMYKACYRGISKDWDACAGKFVQLVREEMNRKNATEETRLMELCCAKHGFLRCVYAASRYKCRKEEALFLKKIAETLSDMRVYSPLCKKVDLLLCSSSVTQTPVVMLLLLTLMLLLTRNSASC